MNQQYGNEREKNLLDDPTLKLYGLPIGNARRSPSLHFYYANNQPRIDLYLNIEDDSQENKHRANLAGIRQLYEFFERFQRTIDNKSTDFADIMEIKESFYIKAEGRYDEAKLRYKLVHGRDKEGRVFIALLSVKESVPKALFYFRSNDKHAFYMRGEKHNEIESSTDAAQGWLNAIKMAYAAVIPATYKHKDKQSSGNKGGNNRGGNSQRGGGNNNYYTQGDDADDDAGDGLPF